MPECPGTPEPCAVLSELTEAIHISRVSTLSSVSAWVLYLYDFALTWSDEVDFIWKSEISTTKVIYFAMRYLTFVFLTFVNAVSLPSGISSELCLMWVRFHWVVGFVIGALTEVPMLLRIYALYNKNKAVLALTATCLLATGISMFVIAAIVMRTEGGVEINFGSGPDMHLCVPTHVNPIYKVFWIPLIINEAILLCLLLMKWFTARSRRVLQSSVVNLVVKESLVYFFGTFPFFLWNHFMWEFSGRYSEVSVAFGIAMSSIMGQRFIVNMRKFRYGQTSTSTPSSTYQAVGVRETQATAVNNSNLEMNHVGFEASMSNASIRQDNVAWSSTRTFHHVE